MYTEQKLMPPGVYNKIKQKYKPAIMLATYAQTHI